MAYSIQIVADDGTVVEERTVPDVFHEVADGEVKKYDQLEVKERTTPPKWLVEGPVDQLKTDDSQLGRNLSNSLRAHAKIAERVPESSVSRKNLHVRVVEF